MSMANIHHPRSGALDGETVAKLHVRHPHARFVVDMLPAVGDIVGVRLHEGGPVLRGVVTRTQSMTEPHAGYATGQPPSLSAMPDPNVWRVVTSNGSPVPRQDGYPGYRYELTADPWPLITVRIDPPPGGKRARIFTETREERMSPLGGWLPASRIEE